MNPDHNLIPSSDQPSYLSHPSVITSVIQATNVSYNLPGIELEDQEELVLQSQEMHHIAESTLNNESNLGQDTDNPAIAQPDVGSTSQATQPQEIFAQHFNEPTRNKTSKRTQFTVYQLGKLEATFNRSQYITTPTRQSLARQLGLSEDSVKNWFKNRRAKWRRGHRQYMRPVAVPVPCLQHFSHVPYSMASGHMMTYSEHFAQHDQHMRFNYYP